MLRRNDGTGVAISVAESVDQTARLSVRGVAFLPRTYSLTEMNFAALNLVLSYCLYPQLCCTQRRPAGAINKGDRAGTAHIFLFFLEKGTDLRSTTYSQGGETLEGR